MSEFIKADPPASPPSTNTLNAAPQEHQETLLNRGLYELRLTSESGKSGTLLKALDSVKVFQAAYMWKLDRLMVEAAHRFGGFISGAFDQAEFPQITTAIFNSVVDPQCMLYGHLVEECFAHCQSLVNNPRFLTALEYNGKLAVHLYRRLADLRASLGHGDMAEVPHGPASSKSTSVVDPSAVTDLQDLLDEALVASFTKQEAVDALEREVTRLEEALSKVTDTGEIKQNHITDLEREVTRLQENVPQRTSSVDLEDQLMALRVSKDAVIDNLEYQLDGKEGEIAELRHALRSANERSAELARQINQKRIGQADNTGFLLERNEALETVKELQVRNTVRGDKTRKLEAQVAAHAQQPITVQAALVLQSPQDAPPRRIDGFGAMTNTVNRINGTSCPPSPLPTPPAPTTPTLAAQVPLTGGVPTFVEIMARRAAAGIHGGEPENGSAKEAPSTMPLATRGVFTFTQQPVLSPAPAVSMNGSATTAVRPSTVSPAGPHAALTRRPAGPHSPQTNGGAPSPSATSAAISRPQANNIAHHVPPRVNGSAAIPIVDPTAAQPRASVAPAADPVAPAATSAATGNGQGDGGPDPRDREIQRLTAEVRKLTNQNDFYQNQLSDARASKLLTFPLSF